MSTVGTETPPLGAMAVAAQRGKLALLLHLLANLPQPLILLAPQGGGKTRLLRQIETHALPGWTVCHVIASSHHSFERIMEEVALRVCHSSGVSPADEEAETTLGARLDALAHQGHAVVLLLDDAGALLPGLLAALCQFARLHPSLKLVFALTPEEMEGKALGDGLALSQAHVVRLLDPATLAHPPLGQKTRAPTHASPVTLLASPNRQATYGLLWGGVLLVLALAFVITYWLWQSDRAGESAPAAHVSLPSTVDAEPAPLAPEPEPVIIPPAPQAQSPMQAPPAPSQPAAGDPPSASMQTSPELSPAPPEGGEPSRPADMHSEDPVKSEVSEAATRETDPSVGGVKATLTIERQWKDGYCAHVDVKNTSGEPQTWHISLPIEGRIKNAWSAQYRQNGNRLEASGVDWNKTLAPGATTRFGFCVSR